MFQEARIKLSALYVLITMIVSISFSLAIYEGVSLELNRIASIQRFRIERRFNNFPFPPQDIIQLLPPGIDPELVAETKQRIIFILIAINAGILTIAGGLGYFLSGQTLAPIQIMVDEQKRFVSDASHDLRTPLAALKSSLEVNLRDPKLTAKEAKALFSQYVDKTNELQNMTDKLLQLSRFTSSLEPIKKISLSPLITQAIEEVKPIAQKNRLTVNQHVADVPITGRPSQLKQLLVILLENAVKYSPADTSITVTGINHKRNIIIMVADQGIGITKKDLPHIFDRFYRADGARSQTGTNGFGLGLAIAKNIVDSHGGSISVTSTKGKGSTFTITLPKKQT